MKASGVARFDELPRLARVNLGLLAGGAAALSVRLWPEWRHNPDLSHGIFMPLVFCLLVREARRGATTFLSPRIWTKPAFVVLVSGALAALVAAGLFAASVDWSHPLVNCSLTTALVLFLTAGLLLFASDSVRFIGWNWTAVVAIALWCLCTPIPPGTYSRLTLGLQLWVSESVLRTLHLWGVPAIRHGNIIELARTTVGVEEACSGVRSLISCLYAGLFFSATLVTRPWARVVIIGLAAPLALLMNFIRSLILTLLSNHGVDIATTWHDLTGFAVLGVTAAILAALALLLERHRPAATAATNGVAARQTRPRGRQVVLTAALGIAAVLVFVSIANTRPSVRRDVPAPDLNALLPSDSPGWQVSTSDDLYQFRDTLQTSDLAQRTYRKIGPNGTRVEVILYAAYWRAGQAPVSLVASHTPDACWPGSGWRAEPVPQPRVPLTVDGRRIAEAEYRRFVFGDDFPQYVWFWHLYDGRPIAYRDPYSPAELLRIAWKYGFRHDGDQLFVRVSSNRPWSELAGDPLIETFFRRTRDLGL
jgi:exosortase